MDNHRIADHPDQGAIDAHRRFVFEQLETQIELGGRLTSILRR